MAFRKTSISLNSRVLPLKEAKKLASVAELPQGLQVETPVAEDEEEELEAELETSEEDEE